MKDRNKIRILDEVKKPKQKKKEPYTPIVRFPSKEKFMTINKQGDFSMIKGIF